MKMRLLPGFVAFAFGLSTYVGGAVVTWTGGGDTVWTNVNNWFLTVPPASGDDVTFDANSTANLGTRLGADFTLNSLTIAAPAGAVSISSNVLSLGAGGVQMGAATVNLTIASTFIPTAAQDWNVAGGRTLTVNGVIQGTNAVTKKGQGALVLGGVNTNFAGGLWIENGDLTVNSSTALGATDVVFNSAATLAPGIRIFTATGVNIPNQLVLQGVGAGSNVVGSLNAGGNDNSGNVKFRFNLRGRDLVIDGGTDRYSPGGGGIQGTGDVWIVDGRVDLSNMTNTWLGALRVPAGGVYQDNTDELVPNTADLYIDGTFQMNTAQETVDALSGTGFVQNITGGTRLLYVGADGGSGEFSGRAHPGAGGGVLWLVKTGAGTQTLAGLGDNDSQRVAVNSGTLVLAKTNSASAHAASIDVVVNGGTLQLAGTGGDQIWDGSVLNVNGGAFDMNGLNEAIGPLQGYSTNGTILNSAAGTLSVLTVGTNNGSGVYYGNIATGVGTVRVVKVGTGTQTFGGNLAVDYLIVSNGIVQIGGGPVSWSFSGTIDNQARVDFAGQGLVVPPALTGTGAVNVIGPFGGVLITNTASFTGPLTVAGGFVQFGNCTAAGDLATTLNMASGTVAFARSDDLIWGTSITGAVNVLKTCDNLLTLAAANTYTGGTRVKQGRLLVSGALAPQRYVSVYTNADLDVGAATVSILPTGRFAVAGTRIQTLEGARLQVSRPLGGSLTNTDLQLVMIGGTYDFRGGVPAASVFPGNDLTNQLAIWMRADAGVQTDGSGNVTNWLDSSKYARDMRVTGTRPLYLPTLAELNNQPVVRCTGLNRLKTPDITGPWPTRNSSVFIVSRATNNFNVQSYFITMVTTASETEPATRFVIHFPWNDGNVYMGLPYGNWLNYQPGAAAMSQFGIWFMRNSGGGLGRPRGRMIVRNGVQEAFDGGAPIYDTPTGRHLALAGWGANAGWQGDLAELMIFTNALSKTEEEQIGWYLARKYGFNGVYEDQPVAQGECNLAGATLIVSNNSTFYGGNATTVRVGSVQIAGGVTSLFQQTVANVVWPDGGFLPGSADDQTLIYPAFASYDMPISGAGAVLVSNGIVRFTGSSLHTYSGGLYLGNYGRLVLAKASGANNATPTNIFMNATVWNTGAGEFHGGIELEADEQIPDGTIITTGGGQWNGFRTYGHTETIAGVTGNYFLAEDTRASDTNGHGIGVFIVSNDVARTLHGIVRDNDGAGTNRLAFTKRGTGTLTFSTGGDWLNWSGPTKVYDGELVVNNSGGAFNGSGAEWTCEVFTNATLTYAQHNHHGAWNGGLSATHTIYEGGTLRNNGAWVNVLSNVTLCGGTWVTLGGYDANQKAWSLKGTLRVTGTNTTSVIVDNHTNSYWGIGLGSNQSSTNFLDVSNGVVDVDLKVDASFYDTFNNTGTFQPATLRKIGDGKVVFGRNQGFTGPLSVEAGTVIITNGTLSGELDISNNTTVVLTGGKGLMGEFRLGFSALANFDAQAAWDQYWATNNPGHLYNSAGYGYYGPRDQFDFDTGYGFHAPYNRNNGQVVFTARWRGKFVAPSTGAYTFFTTSDDGSALWIDGTNVVFNNFAQGPTERSNAVPVTLSAGEHDIAYHFHNSGGDYAFYSYFIPPGGVKQVMSNIYLRCGPAVAGLSGTPGTSLAISNDFLTVAQRNDRTFGGNISGDAGLRKVGTALLVLAGTNTYLGGTEVRGGTLQLASAGAWAGGGLLVEDGTFDLNGSSLSSTNFDGARGTLTNTSAAAVTLTVNASDANRDVFLGNIREGGDIALTKNGTNLLWLGGVNKHSGPFAVNAGILRYDGQNAGTSPVTMAAGTILCGTGSLGGAVAVPNGSFIGPKPSYAPTGTLSMSSLALGSGAGIYAFINGTNPSLRVTGADGLSTGGTTNRIDIVQAGSLGVGTYPLIKYAGTLQGGGFAALTLGSLPAGVVATLNNNTTDQMIELVVTSVDFLRWTGAINNSWDATNLNWVTTVGGLVTNYYEGAQVLFDDTGLNNAITVQAGGVSPGSIVVSNLTKIYTWGGGGIGGSGGIMKQGGGLLVISNANTFADAVIVSNGTLRTASATALGTLAGGTYIRSGGALDLFGQSIGKERVYLAGTGVTNEGCYYNTAAYISGRGTNTPGWIQLLADATISGGPSGYEWGRDAGKAVLDWNGYRLTKIGAGNIWFCQCVFSNAGDTAFSGSGVNLGLDDISNPAFVTNNWGVGDGAILYFYSDDGVRDDLPMNIFATNASIWANGGSQYPNLMKTISLDGATNWLRGGSAGFITGSIVGTSMVARADAGWWAISSTNTYTGGTLLNAGEFILGYGINNAPTNSGTLVGDIVLNGGSFNFAHATAQTLTNNVFGSGAGGDLRLRTGLGMTFDASAAVNATASWFRVGCYNYSQAAFRTGCVVNTYGLLLADLGNTAADASMNGGSVNLCGNPANYVFRIGSLQNTGSFRMQGGLLTVSNSQMSVGWDGTGILYMNGGEIVARSVQLNANGNTGNGRLILDGGKITIGAGGFTAPGVPSTNYLGGGVFGALESWSWDAAQPGYLTGTNGSTVFDSSTNTIIVNGLLSSTGGLVKIGTGRLLLNATNTFSGMLVVSNGSLFGVGSVAAPVVVRSNATLGAASDVPAGTFTLTNNVALDAGAILGTLLNGTNPALRITGVLSNGATTWVRAYAVQPASNATYALVDYTGALSGDFTNAFKLLALPSGVSGYLTNNTVDTRIDLVVTNVTTFGLKWYGNVNSNWDVGVTANWRDPDGNPAVFNPSDSVLLDDTAIGNYAVSIPLPVSPSRLVVAGASNYTFVGGSRISGAVGLIKTGAGTLTLATDNDNAGGTLIAGGTLQVGSGGTNGWFGSGGITNNGSLVFNRANNVTVGVAISGTGSLTKLTSSTLILTNDALHSGGTLISAGTLQVGNNSAAGSLGGVITNNGALTLYRSDAFLFTNNVTGSGGMSVYNNNTIAGNTVALAGDLNAYGAVFANSTASFTNFAYLRSAAGVTVQGGANVRLGQVEQYDGSTLYILGGTLTITSHMYWGRDSGCTITQTGGVFVLQGQNSRQGPDSGNGGGGYSASYGSSGHYTYNLNGGTFVTPNGWLNEGGGAFGAWFSDQLNFGGGTLQAAANNISVNGKLNFTGIGGNFTVDTAGRAVSFNLPSYWPGYSALGGAGGLNVIGGGTVILNYACSYSGATVVASGTLLVPSVMSTSAVTVATNGTLAGTGAILNVVTNSGVVAPGTAGTAGLFTFGSYAPTAAGALSIDIGGTTQGSQYDCLVVSNTAALDGALNLQFISGFTPTGGQSFTLLRGGALSGTFAATNVAVPLGLGFDIQYTSTSVVLGVTGSVTVLTWRPTEQADWDLARTNWVDNSAAPAIFSQGATVLFDDSGAYSNLVNLGTSLVPSRVTVNSSSNYTFSGAGYLSGGLILTKTGTATLVMANTNTYGGGTLIGGGTLQLGDGVNLGTAGSGWITNNAALVFDYPQTNTVSGSIRGSGSVTKNGLGSVTLGAVSACAGGTTVNGGTLALVNGNAGVGALTINAGGVLQAAATDSINSYNPITINNGGLLLQTGGAYQQFNAGPLVMNGGVLESTAAPNANYGNYLLRNNMTVGGTNMSIVRADFRMGDGATRTITVGETGEDIDLFFQGYVAHFHGVTWGFMNKAGPGTVAFSNYTYTVQLGSITVGAGEARFINALGAGSLGNGGLINNARARIEITTGMTQTCNTALSGSGMLVKSGPGRLIISNAIAGTQSVVVDGGVLEYPTAQTYSGNTMVSNGTLLVNGSIGAGVMTIDAGATLGGTGVVQGLVSQNGIVSPGTGTGIGTLTISNQVSCGGAAVTRFELGGTNSYDQLVVSDLHILNGTLEVVTTNGYVPASGDRFNLITNTALGGLLFGPFPTTSLPALPSGMGWEVQYSASDAVNLVVTGSVVSLTAYEQWAAQIPNPADRGDQNDADNDGYANLLEYSQGSDPTNNANNAKLNLVRTNGMEVIVFNRVNTATDIVYEVQASYAPTNNAEWQGLATNSVGSWGSSTNVNDDNTATIHRVWVSDLVLGTNRSLRLKVTRP